MTTITMRQIAEMANRYYEVNDVVTMYKEKEDNDNVKYYEGQLRGICIGYEVLTGTNAFIHMRTTYKGKFEIPLVNIYHERKEPTADGETDYLAYEYNVIGESLKAYNADGEQIDPDRVEIPNFNR